MLSQTLLDDLWDFSDPSGSESRFRDGIARADDAGDAAELKTQLARALGLQDRFAEAEAVLDDVAAVTGGTHIVGVRIALERGRVRNSSGHPESAAALFAHAASAAAACGAVFLHVDALHMLAIVEPDRAAHWTAEALRVLDADEDPRTQRWRVSLHNNAGWMLFDAGDLEGARREFLVAREDAIRWGTKQQVEWADEALAECDAALGT